ncbi:flagellar brake protein [Lentibacillus saliphilus]|uniref:flagellar brake protein n=1 Tax=Lentibacillus saliphilus TaxID=2737028 RepID=UPI001C2FD18A|nr:flagellar brake domain-containing protein [Lentibacillus saliphilus]
MLPVGTTLTITLENSSDTNRDHYRAKVIDVRDKHIFIDYPIDEVTKRTAFLPMDSIVYVSYIGDNDTVYTFKTNVVSREKLTIPALKLSLPEKQDVKKIQRRQYVRIETAVDVALQNEHAYKEPFVSVTLDISGGGLSLIINEYELYEGESVSVCLVLPFVSGEIKYIHADSKVVRIHSRDQLTIASLGFTHITDSDRQAIIMYCFEKQREARRKELS